MTRTLVLFLGLLLVLASIELGFIRALPSPFSLIPLVWIFSLGLFSLRGESAGVALFLGFSVLEDILFLNPHTSVTLSTLVTLAFYFRVSRFWLSNQSVWGYLALGAVLVLVWSVTFYGTYTILSPTEIAWSTMAAETLGRAGFLSLGNLLLYQSPFHRRAFV
ncbi:MAG: hypothetical protein UY98_C0044G0007 [Candidatus Kaiserbacteria bacterium GW2011_GWA2_58_9]|uniref:Rod shape-determining protein MreD n=1 Tax=Candidatus Kaiserbacteria bacterium GW2011_GWA2_58_9 TaxID=1618672 RepID=A0A0G2BII1_9BACT|nr:MAG: hypothetical protein UY98_C0044G0007 [Candidatus Kaiserbacteria bacterium GW2011_GWA2_58_9]